MSFSSSGASRLIEGGAPLLKWYLSVSDQDLARDPSAAGAHAAIDEALTQSEPVIGHITGTTLYVHAKEAFGGAFFDHLGMALARQPPRSYIYTLALLSGAPEESLNLFTRAYEHTHNTPGGGPRLMTFALADDWSMLPKVVQDKVDQQDWLRTSGAPIDWLALERIRNPDPGFRWTMPYSFAQAKLEAAFDSIFLGNCPVLRAGTNILILPFSKRDETADNPDFAMTIAGQNWHILTSDFITMWWDLNTKKRKPAEALEAEQAFLTRPDSDPATLDLELAYRWFLGALLEMAHQTRQREIPASIIWPA